MTRDSKSNADGSKSEYQPFQRRLRATGRIAASAARLAFRRALGKVPGAVESSIGHSLATELDHMKGMAMKVGQILSYFEGILPDETTLPLQRLQHGSKSFTFASMVEVIEAEFGRSHIQLFESFDPDPIAAASIGQVYRARYQGQEVAVKVQYPGIESTISSDFGRLDRIAGLVGLVSPVNGHAIVDDLKTRFIEECDYLREASNQVAFQRAFHDRSTIHIPAVVDARSSKRVLTTEWSDGRDFYRFAQEASSEQRNTVAVELTRFAFESLFQYSAIHADPHPGNYLVGDRNLLTLLDFGCVREFDSSFMDSYRNLVEVIVLGRIEEFREALTRTKLVAKPKNFDFELHWRMLRHELSPYLVSNFHFSREHLKKGLEFSRPSNPNLRSLAFPPEMIWIQRLSWGLHAVLARLKAFGDFRTPFLTALEKPRRPLPRLFDSPTSPENPK